MSAGVAAVSGPEQVRSSLRIACEAVGVRAVLVTRPRADGELVICAWSVASVEILEGELIHPAEIAGLDEHSLPVIDPRGGHVAGALRWVRGSARSALEDSELQTLSLCAQVVAGKLSPGPELHPADPRVPAHSVLSLLAALATRSVRSAWEADRAIQLSEAVARELGLDEQAIADVIELAMLREVGSLGLPPRILEKRGLLSRSEVKVLREQPVLGERIVAAMPDLAHLAPLVRSSHERFDGSGYPDGLAGERIPLASRIVFVCAAYVAMLSDRPYRQALGHETAREIVREGAGGQFCPLCVRTLEGVLDGEQRPAPASELAPPGPAAAPPEPTPAPSRRRHETARRPPPDPRPRARRESAGADHAAGGLEPPELRETRTGAGARMALARGRTAERASKVLYPTGLLAGLVLGVIVALPIRSAEGRCPEPGGEGRAMCVLQKVWVYEITVVALATLATLFVGNLLIFKLPDFYRRARAGELRREQRPPRPSDDPLLLAATWGWTPDAHSRDSRHPGWHRQHPARGSPGDTGAEPEDRR